MKKYILFVSLLLTTVSVVAQTDKNSELYKTIISTDHMLFNVGFNTCDISQFDSLLSDKFEFFHDKDGISDKKEFVYNLRNGLCKSPATYQSRRELLNESTEIYPLYKNKILYGAVQTGTHRFYETIAGKAEIFASTAKFTNVWLLENGDWKLTKSFSYDHQAANVATNKSSISVRGKIKTPKKSARKIH